MTRGRNLIEHVQGLEDQVGKAAVANLSRATKSLKNSMDALGSPSEQFGRLKSIFHRGYYHRLQKIVAIEASYEDAKQSTIALDVLTKFGVPGARNARDTSAAIMETQPQLHARLLSEQHGQVGAASEQRAIAWRKMMPKPLSSVSDLWNMIFRQNPTWSGPLTDQFLSNVIVGVTGNQAEDQTTLEDMMRLSPDYDQARSGTYTLADVIKARLPDESKIGKMGLDVSTHAGLASLFVQLKDAFAGYTANPKARIDALKAMPDDARNEALAAHVARANGLRAGARDDLPEKLPTTGYLGTALGLMTLAMKIYKGVKLMKFVAKIMRLVLRFSQSSDIAAFVSAVSDQKNAIYEHQRDLLSKVQDPSLWQRTRSFMLYQFRASLLNVVYGVTQVLRGLSKLFDLIVPTAATNWLLAEPTEEEVKEETPRYTAMRARVYAGMVASWWGNWDLSGAGVIYQPDIPTGAETVATMRGFLLLGACMLPIGVASMYMFGFPGSTYLFDFQGVGNEATQAAGAYVRTGIESLVGYAGNATASLVPWEGPTHFSWDAMKMAATVPTFVATKTATTALWLYTSGWGAMLAHWSSMMADFSWKFVTYGIPATIALNFGALFLAQAAGPAAVSKWMLEVSMILVGGGFGLVAWAATVPVRIVMKLAAKIWSIVTTLVTQHTMATMAVSTIIFGLHATDALAPLFVGTAVSLLGGTVTRFFLMSITDSIFFYIVYPDLRDVEKFPGEKGAWSATAYIRFLTSLSQRHDSKKKWPNKARHIYTMFNVVVSLISYAGLKAGLARFIFHAAVSPDTMQGWLQKSVASVKTYQTVTNKTVTLVGHQREDAENITTALKSLQGAGQNVDTLVHMTPQDPFVAADNLREIAELTDQSAFHLNNLHATRIAYLGPRDGTFYI